MNIAATVAQHLLEVKAVTLSPTQPFLWTSGIESPIYCDNRKVLSYVEPRNFIKQALATKATEVFEAFDVVAGVATAGIPHGAYVADLLALPYVYVRNRSKAHGLRNLIEGDIKGMERVLVVEDLISTGGSAIRAVDSLREYGCTVVGVISIFNYGFDKAKRAFERADCPYYSLCDYSILIEEALKMSYVQEEHLEILKRWRENPEDWRNAMD